MVEVAWRKVERDVLSPAVTRHWTLILRGRESSNVEEASTREARLLHEAVTVVHHVYTSKHRLFQPPSGIYDIYNKLASMICTGP